MGKILIQDLKEVHYKYLLEQDNSFERYLGFPHFNSIRDVEHYIKKKENYKYWVINYEGQIVGIFYTYDDKYEHWKKCSLSIGIFEEHRGVGIAEYATKEMLDKLIKIGYVRVQIDVEIDNKASIELIERSHIFEYEGTMKNYWGKGITVNMYSYTI